MRFTLYYSHNRLFLLHQDYIRQEAPKTNGKWASTRVIVLGIGLAGLLSTEIYGKLSNEYTSFDTAIDPAHSFVASSIYRMNRKINKVIT